MRLVCIPSAAVAEVQTSTSNLSLASSAMHALMRQVAAEGGWIHPAMAVVDDAPCGCRGIVATAFISAEELAEGPPLVAVPERLCLSSATALRQLQTLLAAQQQGRPGAGSGGGIGQLLARVLPGGGQRAPRLDPAALDPVIVLGTMLAHERSKVGDPRRHSLHHAPGGGGAGAQPSAAPVPPLHTMLAAAAAVAATSPLLADHPTRTHACRASPPPPTHTGSCVPLGALHCLPARPAAEPLGP